MRQPKNTEGTPIQGFCTKGQGQVLTMTGSSVRSTEIPARVLAVLLIADGGDIVVDIGGSDITAVATDPLKLFSGSITPFVLPLTSRFIAGIGAGSLRIVYSTDE